MKTMFRIILAGAIAMSITGSSAFASQVPHTLQEGLSMIAGDAVYRDQMVVKLKPGFELTIPASGSLAVDGQAFRLPFKAAHTAGRLFKSLEATFAREQRERALGVLPPDTVDLSGYIAVTFAAPLSKGEAQRALRDVYSQPEVAFAYFQSHIAFAVEDTEPRSGATEGAANSSDPTPDFTNMQNYLEPAPRGVNAAFGWQQEGGDGKGVHVVDIENAWTIDHEDFNPPFWQRVPPEDMSHANHGTAVWGIVAAKKDGKGITGIAPGSIFGTAKYTRDNADAFTQTAERLKKEKVGVMIIELHRKGPDNNKYAPWEYWQDTFDAFKKITSEYGIHIIAAAGNGNSNLDGSAYNGAFDLSKRDSGAIMVGAAGPAGDRQHLKRLGFSNYGSRLDAFGYGLHVTTTGFGSLFGKRNAQRAYTKNFSGTSSATPIVTGAAVSVLGMGLAKGKLVSVDALRKALRATGTKQKGNATGQRIGNLPDIPQLVEYFNTHGWR